MSSLTGHSTITKEAVRRLVSLCSGNSLARITGSDSADLKFRVMMRDILDVPTFGHWKDSGQPHHFMKAWDGQSDRQAYLDGVEWIKTNATIAAATISEYLQIYVGPNFSSPVSPGGVCPVAPYVATGNNGAIVESAVAASVSAEWLNLAYALHATQDSFSEGHTLRHDVTATSPGAVFHVKMYSGADKDGHEEFDDQWQGAGGGFSTLGEHAVRASLALLVVVLDTAIAPPPISGLSGWSGFVQTHLAMDPAISTQRNEAQDMIGRFATTVRVGDNLATVYFKEKALAKAMIDELGSDMVKVRAVLERLEEHHQTDVGDVVEAYVTLLKSNPAIAAVVRKDPAVYRILRSHLPVTDSDTVALLIWLEKSE